MTATADVSGSYDVIFRSSMSILPNLAGAFWADTVKAIQIITKLAITLGSVCMYTSLVGLLTEYR